MHEPWRLAAPRTVLQNPAMPWGLLALPVLVVLARRLGLGRASTGLAAALCQRLKRDILDAAPPEDDISFVLIRKLG